MRSRLFFFVLLLCWTLCACGRTSTDSRVANLVADIKTRGVASHVEELMKIGPRPSSDAEATERTVSYIKDRLTDYGLLVQEEPFSAVSRYSGEKVEHRNLIVQLLGRDERGKVLEIGAHYDTVPGSPGADDNSSGVAAMLEIIRALSKKNFGKTLRFCFFAMEEDGLLGSRHHVRQLEERGEKIEGIIVLEMIGYTSGEPDSQKSPARIPLLFSPPRVGNFISVIGNFRSARLGSMFEDAADGYVPDLEYFSVKRLGGMFKDAGRSDHSPYWDAGMRGLMLTDTANFRNPHYHRPTDTAETLDFGFLARVARTTGAAAAAWAGIR